MAVFGAGYVLGAKAGPERYAQIVEVAQIRGWRSASRSGRRHELRSRTGRSVRVVPEPTNRLADGVLVEARIRARLLGAPVLRLDAEAVLAPTRTDPVEEVDTVGSPRTQPPGAPPPAPPPALRRAPPGSALAEAVSLVEQGAESLRRLNGDAPAQR